MIKALSFEYQDIPADMQALCDEYRAHLVEAAAEANEEVMEKYLETEDLSEEDIMVGIRPAHAGK